MATKKISDLIAITTVSGAAVLPVVQDGSTVKVTFADLTGSIELIPSASYVLNAVSASYALSASHETTYELSSSFAETATSASHALVSNTATTASFATTATTAITASSLYKDVAPIYVGTQQKDSLAATEMTGEVITIKSNDDATSTPAYVVSNTDGTKLGSFAMQPVDGEVYLSAIGGNLNILSTTSIIKASGSLDIRDSLIVRNGASGSFSGSFEGDGSGLTIISASFATSASFHPGIRVAGFNDNSDIEPVKNLGFVGATVSQPNQWSATITIVTSSFATTASYAATASVASALYKPSGTISVGIGADSNIIEISGSLIQLGNPTLYTETLVSRQLAISGSLVLHNQLGYGFATIGVDNAGDAQIGTNNNLNILLKNDGRTTLYNGVHISASISVQDGEVLTLKPTHPLPSYLVPTGSFAVSASNPAKPYFWDGDSWNPLY